MRCARHGPQLLHKQPGSRWHRGRVAPLFSVFTGSGEHRAIAKNRKVVGGGGNGDGGNGGVGGGGGRGVGGVGDVGGWWVVVVGGWVVGGSEAGGWVGRWVWGVGV
jgi:hypothetical protein